MATYQPRDTPSTTSTDRQTIDMLSIPAMPAMTSRRLQIPPTMSEDDRGLLLNCLAQISCIRMEFDAETTTSSEGNIPHLHTLIDVPTTQEMDNTVPPLVSHTPPTLPTASHTSQVGISHISSPGNPLPHISNTSQVGQSHTSQSGLNQASTLDLSRISQVGISHISSPGLPLPEIDHTTSSSTSAANVLRPRSVLEEPSSTQTSPSLYHLTPTSHSPLSPIHDSSDNTSYTPATVSHPSISSLSEPSIRPTRTSPFQQPILIDTTMSSFHQPTITATTMPSFHQPITSDTTLTSFQQPVISDTTMPSYQHPITSDTTISTFQQQRISDTTMSSFPRMSSFSRTTSSQTSSSAFHESPSLPSTSSFEQSTLFQPFPQTTLGQTAFQPLYPFNPLAQSLTDISSPMSSRYTHATARTPSSTFQNPDSNLPLMSPVSPGEESRSESIETESLSDEDIAQVGQIVVDFLERREHHSEHSLPGPSTSGQQDVLSGQGHPAASWMQSGAMSSVSIQYPPHPLPAHLRMHDPRPEPGTTSQEGQPRLWKFIWDVLEDPRYNPSLITWVSRPEGIFRLTDPGRLAEFWGHVKGNRSMNYEKLSRGLRYYYTYNVLEHVPGKLVYKFGQGATQVMQCLEQSSPSFPVTSYYPPNTSS